MAIAETEIIELSRRESVRGRRREKEDDRERKRQNRSEGAAQFATQETGRLHLKVVRLFSGVDSFFCYCLQWRVISFFPGLSPFFSLSFSFGVQVISYFFFLCFLSPFLLPLFRYRSTQIKLLNQFGENRSTNFRRCLYVHERPTEFRGVC